MTIEPIIAAGGGEVVEAGDGWTVRTADGSLSAHAEHTVVITREPAARSNRLTGIGIGDMPRFQILGAPQRHPDG